MKRWTHVVTFLALSLVIGVAFQNCSGYSADFNALYDNASDTTCATTDYTCTVDSGMVEIDVATEPIYLTKLNGAAAPTSCDDNNSLCFDVGGYCDPANFLTSKFTLEYQSLQSTSLATQTSSVSCDTLGRFHLRVVKPSAVPYDTDFTLVLKMIAVDALGNEYDNARGLNRKEISVRFL